LNRLLSRGICDCRLQFRNGFYFAAIAVAVMLVALLSWAPQRHIAWILPAALLGNLLTNGLYFIAALVLLEKAEHSLDAQIVTPLRAWEYLAAKVASLTLLSIAESAAIVGLVYEGAVAWPALVLGVATMTAVFACCGFLLVARYESINEFLFPSIVVSAVLVLPLLDLSGVWPGALWYLHPLHAPLELIGAAFEQRPAAQLGVAVAIAAAWVSVAFGACVRGFHRFVVQDLRSA
jgi:fluoroquinolone transport system permease protein